MSSFINTCVQGLGNGALPRNKCGYFSINFIDFFVGGHKMQEKNPDRDNETVSVR